LDDTAYLLLPAKISILSEDLAVPLSDTSQASLLNPPSVTSSPTIVDTPFLRTLSDLRTLFLTSATLKAKDNHVTHKLMFYASRVGILPARVLELLSAEVRVRAAAERTNGNKRGLDNMQGQRRNEDNRSGTKPLIKEIS
jgi:hypothetical protein